MKAPVPVPSPAPLPQALAAIARTAAGLCEANDAMIFQVEGNSLKLVAKHGRVPTTRKLGEPFPLDRDTTHGRLVTDRRTVHVPDMAVAVRTAFPAQGDRRRATGVRTLLATPLLRDGRAIGVIAIRRTRVRPFTTKQVTLLKTFADQTAIAIDHARLSSELGVRNSQLEAKNRELTEALKQQTATAEILRAISSSPTNLQPVLETIATNAARVCGAYDAMLVLREGNLAHRVAHHGPIASHLHELGPISRSFASGRAILDRETVHVHDVLATEAADLRDSKASAQRSGFRTVLAVPLLRKGDAIGSLTIRRHEVQPFTDKQIALLRTFADQAVIAIENVRLFKELEARNRDLSEALDRQTATAEILRVISQAQTDIQPVFEAIADSAMRLFAAWSVLVYRYDGEFIRLAAARGGLPGSSESIMERYRAPSRPAEDTVPGRTVVTRAVQHVADVDLDVSWGPRLREDARARGFRSAVSVPMLRGGDVVGTIAVTRAEVGGFTPAEIALLQTFADQAVIAVENARLLTELRVRRVESGVPPARHPSDGGRAGGRAPGSAGPPRRGRHRTRGGAAGAGTGPGYPGRSRLRAAAAPPAARPTGLPVAPLGAAPVRAAHYGRPRGVEASAGQLQLRGGEPAPDLRQPVVPGHQQRPALPQDRGQGPPARGREPPQVTVPRQHIHELRTPLNAILGYTELIVDGTYGEVPERMGEVLDRVDKSGRHLLA